MDFVPQLHIKKELHTAIGQNWIKICTKLFFIDKIKTAAMLDLWLNVSQITYKKLQRNIFCQLKTASILDL